MAATCFFVPDLTGDDLAIEVEKFRKYLMENGWRGMTGEDDLKGHSDEGVIDLVKAPGD